ncbi:uncharacterized protein BDZ99DRAFT_60731 [Mytilinidion resinicola]|uniref:Uncharacterized protein n=1 Tax=Mytilinidion resinicola TaxID=574789 RepID=A0A6A6YG57_9PEZI|nr:uncharacterized protein BDZ99DRAFT_60731 [Mytilinidion resinicola]KAF2807579.1 hypothetical protein BDZ99DRAFT_60731 [Mytilinidion resinicola]
MGGEWQWPGRDGLSYYYGESSLFGLSGTVVLLIDQVGKVMKRVGLFGTHEPIPRELTEERWIRLG